MSLFRCTRCGCVENTACSDFYWDKYEEKIPVLCSECKTGKWHGEFPKKSADGYFYDKDDLIYHPEEVDQVKMVWKYNPRFKMVGRYEEKG